LPLPPRDPFTLFVWEVLAVHSTPRKRDAALAALKRIPALTPDSMWRAPQKKLEASVKLAGPYTENRLTALRRGADLFRRRPARSVQDALTRELPASVDAYRRVFVYLSHHGGATCTEADPHCPVCPLLPDCPEGKKRIGARDSGTRDWGLVS